MIENSLKNRQISLRVQSQPLKKRVNSALFPTESKIICDTILPALGHGAMAAHQPLELWILVRIQVPQPDTSAIADYFSKTGFVAEQCIAAQILF